MRPLAFSVAAALLIASALPADEPPEIAGCPVFPADNIWNTPIDSLPVHLDSAAWVQTIGADKPLHPDFGAGLYSGGPIGIPFVVVPGDQPKVPVRFQYSVESDPGPYPVPPGAPIEGGAESTGDRHVLVLDRDNCFLYELFSSYPQPDGSWNAGSGAIFDLKSHKLRLEGWTSADAAGLPVLPGLVRYEEVAAGEIRHAIRFTVPQTRRAYVWPGRHFASSLMDARYPPMGQRFRLRKDFDISGFSPANRVILRALKKYGMILSDNGSSWFISGAPNESWSNEQLRQLRQVKGSDFEAVDSSSLRIDADSGQAKLTGSAAAVVNSATFVAGPVSPGEIVAIFGSGLGPETPLLGEITGGTLSNELGGTSVSFNGVPSPLLYVSSGQINAVVPYAVAGRAAANVEVRRFGSLVFDAVLPVAAASPGIFAITDPQFVANSDSNPAAPGSAIILWATGEGETDPPGVDGRIALLEFPKPKLPVRVTIGDQEGWVLHAGAAPLLVAGSLQVNVAVPPGLVAGRWPLTLLIGPHRSPPGPVVAVR